MKLFTKLLTLMLVLALSFSFVACNNDDDGVDTSDYTGWAFEYEEKTDDDNNEYYLITGLFVADGDATAVASGLHNGIDLTVGANGEITVPVYEKDENGEDKPTYTDGKLNTTTVKLDEAHTYFEIADDAFANQLIINSAVIDKSVTKIGVASFAGCANLESITLPFIGNEIGAVNASKVFANIFGSAEAANCTAVTANYNESGTATFYVPNALTSITVNFEGENAEVPAYAFYGLNSITSIAINGNVTKINRNAFTNCTDLISVTLPATVTEIGRSAFSACTSMLAFDFAKLTALTTIGQEAFSGCIGLGYGKNTVITMGDAVASLGDKAFYGCTSIKAIDLKNVESIGYACFFNCSELKSVTHSATEVGAYAFENCHDDLAING